MLVTKGAYDRVVAARDEVSAFARHFARQADEAADEAGRLRARLARAEQLAEDHRLAADELRAEIARLRQPRGKGGRFDAKVRP